MKRAPIYNVRTWKIRAADDRRIVFRPAIRTVAIRLQATVACFAIIGAIEYGVHRARQAAENRPPLLTSEELRQAERQDQEITESMRREFGDDFVDRVERDVEVERAARQADHDAAAQRIDRIRHWLQLGRYALYGLLAAAGVLPPLSCIWSRVSISRTVRGEISVFALGILPRQKTWVNGHFERLRTYAMERYWFGRHGIIARHAWDWYVQLAPRGMPHMPVTMTIAWAERDLPPQFLVHRQKYQPGTKDRVPEPVRDLVKALRALTGLSADQPQIVEARLERSLLGRRVTRRLSHGPGDEIPVSHETHTFSSVDEMPPHLREKLRDLLETGEITRRDDGAIEAVKRRTVELRGPHGERLDPDQLEHLPPDIRKRVEDLMGRDREQ